MKKQFYLSVCVCLIWVLIAEWLSRGVMHGPDYLPLHLSFCFLLCSLIGIFLQVFKATRIMGATLMLIPVAILIFVLVQMITYL